MSFTKNQQGACPLNNYCALLFLYNNGAVNLKLVWMLLYNGSNTRSNVPLSVNYTLSGTTGGTCSKGSSVSIPSLASVNMAPMSSPLQVTLTIPSGCLFESGVTYNVNILAQFGNNVVYYAVAFL